MPCPAASCTFAANFADLAGCDFSSFARAFHANALSYAMEHFCGLDPGMVESAVTHLLDKANAQFLGASDELSEGLHAAVENLAAPGSPDDLKPLKSALHKWLRGEFGRLIRLEGMPWKCTALADFDQGFASFYQQEYEYSYKFIAFRMDQAMREQAEDHTQSLFVSLLSLWRDTSTYHEATVLQHRAVHDRELLRLRPYRNWLVKNRIEDLRKTLGQRSALESSLDDFMGWEQENESARDTPQAAQQSDTPPSLGGVSIDDPLDQHDLARVSACRVDDAWTAHQQSLGVAGSAWLQQALDNLLARDRQVFLKMTLAGLSANAIAGEFRIDHKSVQLSHRRALRGIRAHILRKTAEHVLEGACANCREALGPTQQHLMRSALDGDIGLTETPDGWAHRVLISEQPSALTSYLPHYLRIQTDSDDLLPVLRATAFGEGLDRAFRDANSLGLAADLNYRCASLVEAYRVAEASGTGQKERENILDWLGSRPPTRVWLDVLADPRWDDWRFELMRQPLETYVKERLASAGPTKKYREALGRLKSICLVETSRAPYVKRLGRLRAEFMGIYDSLCALMPQVF